MLSSLNSIYRTCYCITPGCIQTCHEQACATHWCSCNLTCAPYDDVEATSGFSPPTDQVIHLQRGCGAAAFVSLLSSTKSCSADSNPTCRPASGSLLPARGPGPALAGEPAVPDLPRRRTRLRITSQSSSENLLHDIFGFQLFQLTLDTSLPLQQPVQR